MLPEIDSLWDYPNPEASEARFRELLGRPDLTSNYRAEVSTQLPRALCLQRNHIAAQQVLDDVLPLVRNDANRVHVRHLLETGRLHRELGRHQSGVPLFECAWELACECGEDHLAIDAAHMLGYTLDGDAGRHWHELGIAKAEASADARARRWLFRLYNNPGKRQAEVGDCAAALASFRKMDDWCEANNASTDHRRDTRLMMAYAHRLAGEVDQAYRLLCELEQSIESSGGHNDGYLFEHLGECLLAMNEPEDAKAWFSKAYQLLKDDAWFDGNVLDPEHKERIRRLGGC